MPAPIKNLPVLLGALRQESADGELVLEQNDGVRRLYFSKGELVHLKSDAAGEQFGNYLLRQGILDFPALSELLANEERYRLGEKVIQWGMMNLDERDSHLQSLQEQIMIHALEHPVLSWEWHATSLDRQLEQDLQFKLQHRHFVWNTFQECHYLTDLLEILGTETDWRWEGNRDLVETLSDLPLTPGTAYALSFLSSDPISFETFLSLSNLQEEEAGRFIVTLWALGALTLTAGRLPLMVKPAAPAPPPAPAPAPAAKGSLPFIMPPHGAVPAPPKAPLPPLEISLEFDKITGPPEFLDVDPDPAPRRMDLDQGMMYSESPLRPAPPPPLPPPPLAAGGYRPDPFSRQDPFQPPPPIQPMAPPPAAAAAPAPDPFQPLPPPPIQAPKPPAPALEGPAKARSLLRNARQQLLMDRTIEAIRTLEQAVQLEPEADVAYESWLLLGQLRLSNPAWSTRAIDALQNASKLRPRAAQPWATMGELYHRKGFNTNAVACYNKALMLDPSVPIPPDIDLDAKEPAPAPPPPKRGILGKLGSIMGRPPRKP